MPPHLRRCPLVLGFVVCGILVMVFVRGWISYTATSDLAIADAPKRTYMIGDTSFRLKTSATSVASNLLTPLNGRNATEHGSRSAKPSVIRGQAAVFSCESLRNGTHEATESSEEYVTLSPTNIDSRRLGNQLFNLAAILMVAKLTQRTPIFPAGWLDNAFDLRVARLTPSRAGSLACPCYTFYEQHSMHFDERLPVLAETRPPERGLLISGYFQSWRYIEYVDNELRCRMRFREKVRDAAELFLVTHNPTEWETGTYARVGVHVRRSDFLNPDKQQHGYTIPTMTYFRSAVDYFRKRHSRVHLVVATDDLAWTRKNFEEFRTGSDVRVTFSENNTGPVDLAILASCHSLVLSTGTFGWWAAWLANVTTVYFKDWPQPGSVLDSHFRRGDFFPPQWIAV